IEPARLYRHLHLLQHWTRQRPCHPRGGYCGRFGSPDLYRPRSEAPDPMTPEHEQSLGIMGKAVVYTCLAVYAFWSMFPILWVLLISFKTSAEALSVPPQLIFGPTLANYRQVFQTVYEFPAVILNSVLIAAVGTFIILVLAVPAAYGLSR